MQLTVASLNTQHSLQASAQSIGSAVRSCAADVALFQEVDYRAWRSRLTDYPTRLSKHTGLSHVFYSPSIQRGIRRYGLLTVSRYPLLDRATVDLPRQGNEEPRVAQLCTLDAPPFPIRLINVHLSTNLESGAAQLEHLVHHLGTDSKPTIISGDFNGQPIPDGFSGGVDTPTWPWHEPRAVLDRILVTPHLAEGAKWESFSQIQLSDHTLVLAHLSMEC